MVTTTTTTTTTTIPSHTPNGNGSTDTDEHEMKYVRPEPQALCYKSVDGLDLLVDVYVPREVGDGCWRPKALARPAVVYFHGGGLTCGDRQTWFPEWLCRDTLARGYLFLSADHRLLLPATGHDLLADVLSLFAWLASPACGAALRARGERLTVDSGRLAAAGSSAGGYVAYLAGMHALPRPRAVLSLYGMGGDFLSPHYLTVKTVPFYKNRPLLPPDPFHSLLSTSPPPPTLSGSKLIFDSTGYPADPRILLTRFLLQRGTFLDVLTGIPSLSHPALKAHDVPMKERKLFPQLAVGKLFPPMLVFHGTGDTQVPCEESVTFGERVREVGGKAEVVLLEGRGHSFDYHETGWEEEVVGRSMAFLEEWLEW